MSDVMNSDIGGVAGGEGFGIATAGRELVLVPPAPVAATA